MRWLLRPFKHKLSSFITGCVGRALDERIVTRVSADELSLVLDTLITEHFRLQEQVEMLRRRLEEKPSSLRVISVSEERSQGML